MKCEKRTTRCYGLPRHSVTLRSSLVSYVVMMVMTITQMLMFTHCALWDQDKRFIPSSSETLKWKTKVRYSRRTIYLFVNHKIERKENPKERWYESLTGHIPERVMKMITINILLTNFQNFWEYRAMFL